MRHDSRGVKQLDEHHSSAVRRGLRDWIVLRLKPVVSPVEWLVRQAPDGVYRVEVNRGFGWRPEAEFKSLAEAFAHGRTLHGDCLPQFLQQTAPLSYKG